MPKFELTKTIEAVRLNQRTLRPLSDQRISIPFGAIVEKLTAERDVRKFFYLGQPYQCPSATIESALKEIAEP